MCPMCIATLATVVAGATSTGGLTTLVVDKLVQRRRDRSVPLIRTTASAVDSTKESAHDHFCNESRS